MKINDVLHRRQYTINLSSNTPPLDLASLSNMGVWSNPKEKHYILTLTHNDDPINDSSMFEKILRSILDYSQKILYMKQNMDR